MSESVDAQDRGRKSDKFFSKYLSDEVFEIFKTRKPRNLKECGYTVWQGNKRSGVERRYALKKRAVPELGLKAVADELISLINWYDYRNSVYYANAICTYARDLAWLKAKYYDPAWWLYDFEWPQC